MCATLRHRVHLEVISATLDMVLDFTRQVLFRCLLIARLRPRTQRVEFALEFIHSLEILQHELVSTRPRELWLFSRALFFL
jgi:hypothetical protein